MTWLPEPIGDEIRREFRRFGPESALADVVVAWPVAVGPGIAANAWPARIARDRTLHVATSSSAWAFELTQLADSILARLQEHVPVDCPTALRFAVGPLPEAGTPSEESLSGTVPKADPEAVAEGERIAEGIGDTALREAVARAAAASLAARKGSGDDRPL
jgi:predicted nucleic acid-binding Zn ribbon protein